MNKLYTMDMKLCVAFFHWDERVFWRGRLRLLTHMDIFQGKICGFLRLKWDQSCWEFLKEQQEQQQMKHFALLCRLISYFIVYKSVVTIIYRVNDSLQFFESWNMYFFFQFVSYILDQLIDLIAVGSLIVTYGEMPNSSTKI